jgi:similar to stage IV sporulation protein
MLLSVIKYFKGYVYVRLSGYAPERFLNLCGSRDILIWNLKSIADGYEFCISVAGFKQLRPILKKTRTHIRIIKKYGMPFELYHYRKRKMFAMGMILFAGLLYYLSGFIWNIEVNGMVDSLNHCHPVFEFILGGHQVNKPFGRLRVVGILKAF